MENWGAALFEDKKHVAEILSDKKATGEEFYFEKQFIFNSDENKELYYYKMYEKNNKIILEVYKEHA